MPTRPLAYVIHSQQVDGRWQGTVRAQCSGCGSYKTIRWNSYNNPNHIANYFKRLQWDFDPYRKRGIRCPSCLHQQPLLLTNQSAPPARKPIVQREPDFSTFGKRVRWAREQVHVPRDQLADEAKINRTILEHIEMGTTNTGLIQLDDVGERLAAVLASHGAMVDANWLNGTPPAPKVEIPKPASKPEPTDEHPGQRLRRRRVSCGLSQGALAALIFGKPGTESWGTNGSVQAIISAFERNGRLTQSHKRMVALAEEVFRQREPAAETPQKPTKAQETLPAAKDTAVHHTLPAATAEALRADLRKAENDLAELRKMLEDLEPLRQMVLETTQRVEAIKRALMPAPETKTLRLRQFDHAIDAREHAVV